MREFEFILTRNILPLALIIGVGMLLGRIFPLDLKTLSKLTFHLFTPVVIFKLIYESHLSPAVAGQVLLFLVLFLACLLLAVEAASRIRKQGDGRKQAMRNSVLLYNSGNYAIPLNQLYFGNDPFSMSIQVIVMIAQNILGNTYGVMNAASGRGTLRDSLRSVLTLPSLYVIPAAFLMKGFRVPVPQALSIPIGYVADAYVAIALVTLGIQLGSMKWKFDFSDVLLSNVLRLCAGPVIGYLLVLAMGYHGTMAQALVLSCAVPTSVSSVLLAVEYDNQPQFASQAVFSSTVFSMFTMAVVIYLLKMVG
ncbi:AEC family transporter [Cohnella caldifontis]|uniref:AEC family transporter n=1 Tax=Cohnella caldifontis TaxID=3027471 RepID=UPI0023EBE915|nr:AEC family transporter [Cohnella sp. YIM B05605]